MKNPTKFRGIEEFTDFFNCAISITPVFFFGYPPVNTVFSRIDNNI